MATGHSTSANLSPVARVRVATAAARGRRRALVTFLVGLGGLLLAAAMGSGAWWWVVVWLPVGLVAGSIARQARLVWVAWLSVAAYYPIATALGVQRDSGPFWYLGAVLGGAIL